MTYPTTAGHQAPETSLAAARHVEDTGKAPILRDRCENYVRTLAAFGATAQECAEALGESINDIRPRFTELKNRGTFVYRGSKRTPAGSRCSQRVLVHKEHAKEAPF